MLHCQKWKDYSSYIFSHNAMQCWASVFPHTALSIAYSSNSPLTPSARISALNIVSDLLRKVGVSPPFRPPFLPLPLPCPLLPLHHCFHRLWSRSWRPAGTSPRTRGRGKRSLWTTATCSTPTRPAKRFSPSIRPILRRREWTLTRLPLETFALLEY